MSRRSALALLLVAGLSVTGPACGGSSSNQPRRAARRKCVGNSDAQGVLSSIRTNVATRVRRRSSLSFHGNHQRVAQDPTLGAFLTQADIDPTSTACRHEGEEVRI